MKHGQNNNRRQRSRGNPRNRYPNQKGGSFESNGPEAKVRGTAQQILEKYQSLARDAYSAGDRILAEGYLQHAEHYYRILNSDNDGRNRDNNQGRHQNSNRDDDQDYDDQNDESEARNDNKNENKADNKKDGKGDADNGLKRTVSRGRNGGEQSSADDSGADTEAESKDAESKDADQAGEKAEEAPRKPRQRRSRKTEQAPAESTDQSAAD